MCGCLCSEIVDRAQKELNIEKQIKKIEDTWSVLALVFTPLPDSDVTALQVWCCRGAGGCHVCGSKQAGVYSAIISCKLHHCSC